MPQFDLSQFNSQIFWLILCFAILYLYTFFYTVPRLNKIYQARWQAVEGKISYAQRLQDQCDQLKLDYQNKLSGAHAINQNKVNESIHKFNEQVHQQKLAIDRQIKTQITLEKDQISAQMSTKTNASQIEIEALANELTDQLLNINTNGKIQQSKGASINPPSDHNRDIS